MKRAAGVTTALAASALIVASVSVTASAGNESDVGSARATDPNGLVRTALAAVTDRRAALSVGAGQDFRVTDTIVDPDGTTHVRMDRTYRGLPVLGGDMVVHQAADGSYEGASLTLSKAPAMSIDARVSPSLAGDLAKSLARGLDITGLRLRDNAAKLVVDAIDHAPRLAWQVTTIGTQDDGTPSRLHTYIDAKTGKVLRSEETIETADGEGRSLYSGTVPIETTELGDGTFDLKSPSYGDNYTTDAENQTDSILCQLFGIPPCAPNTQITDDDNVWGDGTNDDRQSAAVDAQYGANMTYDYYQAVHNRAGIWDDGSGAQSRVHYGNAYVNAFWDGEKMTYGDGENNARPLTALDVAGHEMSHGVTEATAGLTYSGESGGLNESTSDIFGSMVEFHAGNAEDAGDYDIGEKIDIRGDGSPLRYMYEPSLDGNSADCWSDGVGDLDVHYSSGVGNHFFFLLAEGSGDTQYGSSPTCDGSSVTGIGHEAAEQIWYRALTTYMTSNTDYHGARDASLSAAADLFGQDSAEYNAVDTAWAAVNVA
jgi:Zn-dependent metalloprotease